MQDELNQIDVACAEALKKIKDEQDVIDGRIKAMDEMKSEVAEVVYLRVRADYKSKRDALDAQAKPLREQAQAQYLRLMAAFDELEASNEAVQLDKQETELRHQLGEFNKEEFGKRMKAIDAAAAEQSVLFEKARGLREKFLAAVRGEEELRVALIAPAAPNALATPATPPMPAAAGHVTQPEMPAITTAEIPKPVAPVPPAAPKTMADGTLVMPAMPTAPAAVAAKPVVTEATVMFKPARLVPQNPEAGKTTYALTLKPMGIGSDTGNDIRIAGPGVEPKHAQIVPTPQGYSLMDFDTKHGTRVNAEKVKDRVLNNEDVVQIGAARFVFRSS
jgi:hypothetical protein